MLNIHQILGMIYLFDNLSQLFQYLFNSIYGSTLTGFGPDYQPELIAIIHKMLHVATIQT